MSAILPALIKGGASLLGGLLGKRSRDKANAANSPVAQVNQWKAAGINPLFGISSGAFIPQQASSFGDAFARAGGQFAESLEGAKEQELRETRLELENELLKKKLDKQAKDDQPGVLEGAGVLPLPMYDEKTWLRTPEGNLRPLGRPTTNREMFPVVLPNGVTTKITVDQARRLRLEPYDTITAGEWPEIAGEILGEGANLAHPKHLGGDNPDASGISSFFRNFGQGTGEDPGVGTAPWFGSDDGAFKMEGAVEWKQNDKGEWVRVN